MLRLLPAFVLFLGFGCSPPPLTTCQNYLDALSNYSTKVAPCQGDGGGMPMPVTANFLTCEVGIGTCTAADVNAINAYAACLNSLPTCDPANPAAFTTAFSKCAWPQTTNCVP